MVVAATRRLKHWGWGYEDQALSGEELAAAAKGAREHLGFGADDVEQPVPLEDVELPQSRLAPPASLASICSDDRYDRVSHALGKAYRDVVRGFRASFEPGPPDVVARPTNEDEVAAVLQWCVEAGAAAIPFGGGTSVVGGVEARVGDEYSGVVTIDLREYGPDAGDDRVSQAALIQAGRRSPGLEASAEKEHGLPPVLGRSAAGVATRAISGHFATLRTHVGDSSRSVRAIAERRVGEVSGCRRAPGARSSPDRMLIGSERESSASSPEAWV